MVARPDVWSWALVTVQLFGVRPTDGHSTRGKETFGVSSEDGTTGGCLLLSTWFEQLKCNAKQGARLLMGDFNARIQERLNETESMIGIHTFCKDHTTLHSTSAGVIENRSLLLNFLSQHRMISSNTFFEKHDSKLFTYREMHTKKSDPHTRGFDETLD